MSRVESVLSLQGGFDMSHRVRHMLKSVLDELYQIGKGVKKGELQRQMKELKKEKVSYFIHTSTTKVRYERAAMKFADYLEQRGIKRKRHLNKLDTEQLKQVIDDYFKKLAEEKYSKTTIKVHVCALEKSLAIVRPDIRDYLANDENRIKWWSQGTESRKRGSYVNPNGIRQRLKEEYRMIAEAQALAGLRVREIARTEVDKQNYQLIIHKAKGGRTRILDFSHRRETFEKLASLIEKLKEMHYEQHLKEYYKDIKNACKALGEEYRASHAFRYEYVEKRVEQLKENKEELKDLLNKYNADEETKSYAENEDTVEKSIDFVLTREIGHNRTSMSRYYYK
jgi:hypothetical protein